MLTILYIISKLHEEEFDDNYRGTYKSDMLVNASYHDYQKYISFWGGDFQDNAWVTCLTC